MRRPGRGKGGSRGDGLFDRPDKPSPASREGTVYLTVPAHSRKRGQPIGCPLARVRSERLPRLRAECHEARMAERDPGHVVTHYDLLIVGAGISGIDAAYRFQAGCPGKSYAILEARDAIGGTWDLFRYPGIRSDSDMYTLGFPFRPWSGDLSIAGGAAIRDYVEETARAFGIHRQIRFRHRVVAARWESRAARWTLEVE